jgi:hypothetical protein
MTVQLLYDGRMWYMVIREDGQIIERWGWLMSLPND